MNTKEAVEHLRDRYSWGPQEFLSQTPQGSRWDVRLYFRKELQDKSVRSRAEVY